MSRTDEEEQSHSDSSSEEGDEGENGNRVESLVAGRERRATAGRWMGNLVARAAAEDAEQDEVDRTLDEIFDEGLPEDDIDFQEDAGVDDQDLAISESDSEEDAGPGQDDDNLEGEKQLRKAERAEKLAKKRKARDALMAPLGHAKKAKTTPTAPTPVSEQAKKPRLPKKSERQSWIPTGDGLPTRASTRTQAVRNKAIVHARMKESEKRRQKTVASMEAAARRKQRDEQPPKTQEQRMAEAALVERKNNRSLNRWQLAEDQRQAEQKAKLEALRSKKLEGPVIRWYSGPGHWMNGSLKGTGKDFKIETTDENISPEDPQKDSSSTDTNNLVSARNIQGLNGPEGAPAEGANGPNPTLQTHTIEPLHQIEGEQATKPDFPNNTQIQSIDAPSPPSSAPVLQGIYDFANLPYQNKTPTNASSTQPSTPHLPLPPFPPHTTTTTTTPALRNLITLHSFPALDRATRALDRHDAIRSILLGHPPLASSTRSTRTAGGRSSAKPRVLTCAVTDQPARYLDPHTGLAYASLYAYRMLRKVLEGRCRWSELLGCWVGPEYELPWGKPAAGVPSRFGERGGAKEGVGW